MNSKMILGQYIPTNSWFHKLDPRTKIIGLFLMMITVFIISNLYVLLGCFGFILLLVITTKISLWRFIKSLRTILLLLLFTISFQILFNKTGEPLATGAFSMRALTLGLIIGGFILFILSGFLIKRGRLLLFLVYVALAMLAQYYIKVTPELLSYEITVYTKGLLMGAQVTLRIVNLVFLSSLLTLTTKPTDLNRALEKLLRSSTLAMMTSIAIRFIPTLVNESQRILKAQASRGVDFNEINLKDKVVQITSLLIPMFVIAYKRSDELAYAMQARGYIPGAKRTAIAEIKFRWFDYIVLFLVLAALAAVITLKILKVGI